jgi:hypothetical protein
MSPLVFAALIAVRARRLLSLTAQPAGRGAAATPVVHLVAVLTAYLSELTGNDRVVSQFFAWFYLPADCSSR